ncbi:MAG: OmpA family protein [Pseudomonadales bacterium]|nr:OmpA family protein [Pseudomonadales bacterium]
MYVKVALFLISSLILSACATDKYVKRDEFNSTVQDLRQSDEALATDLAGFRSQFTEMTQDLHTKFEGYDATLGNLQGRLRVEMSAHFGHNDAALRDGDKPALDEFSEVMRQYTPHVVVTVEGFTDPSGNAEYNKQLGLRRAESVREYLVSNGGLPADQVRAVSYGEDTARQLSPGASGESGSVNRRVSLVVDYVGLAPQRVD